jgi:membrane-bound lytic murein transglycosylase D
MSPIIEPAIRVDPPPVAELSRPFLSPPPEVLDDPILDSRWASNPTIRKRSDFWMDHWQNRGARDFQIYLNRLEWYRPLVEAEIEARGLPLSLLYLPIIESGYTARAVSPANAVGLWQMMAGTARERGLTVTAILDERRDPVRATPEALGFLRDFIPKLIAAATLGARPGHYGFEVAQGPRFNFDEVEVPDAISVDVIARAAGVSQEQIETLNPQLLRGFTPPDVSTVVRVPAGRGPAFREGLALIPTSEWVSFLEHKVVSGETFSHIARRYGVRVSTLRAANPGTSPRRLQIGQWVVVPVAPASSPRSRR